MVILCYNKFNVFGEYVMADVKKAEVIKKKVEAYPLSVENSSYDAAFATGIKKIIINDAKNNTSDNVALRAILAHEAWHMGTDASGVHDLPMSLSQHYKLRIHDEISAYLVELMQVREEYIHAQNDEERQKIVNSRLGGDNDYKWYFDAIKQGKINPLSKDISENLDEFKFMAQETQKMFFNHKDHAEYWAARNDLTKQNFLTADLADLAENDENYHKALRQMYTIGGHDFSSDIVGQGKDIDDRVPDVFIAADKKIAEFVSQPNSGVKEDDVRLEIEAGIGIEMSAKNRESYAKLRKTKDDIDKEKQIEKLAKKVLGNNIDKPRQYEIFDFEDVALEVECLRNSLAQAKKLGIVCAPIVNGPNKNFEEVMARLVKISKTAQDRMQQKIAEHEEVDKRELTADVPSNIYKSRMTHDRD